MFVLRIPAVASILSSPALLGIHLLWMSHPVAEFICRSYLFVLLGVLGLDHSAAPASRSREGGRGGEGGEGNGEGRGKGGDG